MSSSHTRRAAVLALSTSMALSTSIALSACGLVPKNRTPASTTATCIRPFAKLTPSSVPDDGEVGALAFSADGKTIATAGKPIELWDAPTGAPGKTVAHTFPSIGFMRFSPDGKQLALGSSTVTVRDFLGFEPTGGAAGSGGKYPVALWNVETGKPGDLLIHDTRVGAIRFAPDASAIATMPRLGDTVNLWKSGKVRTTVQLGGHAPHAQQMEFSPDGKTLAVASSTETIRLWDSPAGELRSTLPIENTAFLRLDFSPDGRTLASLSIDGPIHLWDVATGKEVGKVTVPKYTDDFAFQPDSKVLLVRYANGVGKFDVASGKEVSRVDFCPTTVRTKSGSYLVFDPAGTMFLKGHVLENGKQEIELHGMNF